MRHTWRLAIALATGAALLVTACGGGTTSTGTGGGGGTQSAACQTLSSKYSSLKGQSLVVGTAPGSNYYDAPDPNNADNVIGVEPDLLSAVANCIGFKVTFSKTDFNGLISALQVNRINVISAGMYATPVRAQTINFVAYMKAAEASVIQKGNPKHISSLDGVCGLTAAEVVGTVENAIFDDQNKKCVAAGKSPVIASLYQGNDQAINAVIQGRSDIFLTDAGVASYLVKQFPTSIQVGFPIVSDFQFGLGVNKSNTTLLNALEDTMTELYKNGTQLKLMLKWGFAESQIVPPHTVTS